MYTLVRLKQLQQSIRLIEAYLGRRNSNSWDMHLRQQREVARPQARPVRRVRLEVRTHP